MSRLLLLLLLCLAPVAVGSPASELSPEAAAEDVRLLRTALESVHPGYGRYTGREAMDTLLDRLEERASGPLTDADLYLEVSRVLAALRCDHTKAELPDTLASYRETVPTYLPFRIRGFGDRLFVERAPEGSPLARGDEILSIHGIPSAQLLHEVRPLVPVDGWTDPVKERQIAFSTEFQGGALDHFLPFLHGWRERFEVAVRGGDGTVETVALGAVTYDAWQEIARPGETRYGRNFDTSTTLEMRGSTAILTVGTFVNYRTNADPEAVFEPLFRRAREAGAERLVIDLRECGGGSTEVPGTLLRYLAPEPFRTAARAPRVRAYRFGDLRAHLATWDPRALEAPDEAFRDLGDGWYEVLDPSVRAGIDPRDPFPAERRFTGEVIVLCGPANASGATDFLAVLRTVRPDVRFWGEPTGGSAEGPTAGILFFLELPNSGITVRVPWFRQWNAARVDRPGFGIDPDEWIAPTLEDWLAGRDPMEERLGALR